MKQTLATRRRARLLAASLALSASIFNPISVPLAIAGQGKEDSPGFIEKMKRWQDEMTDKFRDTWQDWQGKKDGHSLAAASVDLREQKDSYTVRLNLPNRDLAKVDIRLEGDALHIVAPAEEKVGRYEQMIDLGNVAPDAKLQIERKEKDRLIVVTVPKSPSTANAAPSSRRGPATGLSSLDDWDRDVFTRMEKMRREMDRVFDESFREFRLAPEHDGFFDRPRFGSSLDLQEEGDHYVVRAYLPDRDTGNVKVTVEGQTLKVEAKAEETEKKEDKGVVRSHKAQYAQVITLPGPVQAEKMKVDKKDGMLVVTLPKG